MALTHICSRITPALPLVLGVLACSSDTSRDAKARQEAIDECAEEFSPREKPVEFSECAKKVRIDGDLNQPLAVDP